MSGVQDAEIVVHIRDTAWRGETSDKYEAWENMQWFQSREIVEITFTEYQGKEDMWKEPNNGKF